MSPAFLAVALALAADLPAELEALEKDAETWFVRAGDRHAPAASRNDCRRKSWAGLRKALDILDRHSEKNPADRPRIQERHARAAAMAWWLRRESPVGLLDEAPAGAPGPGGGAPSRNPFDSQPGGPPASSIAGPPPGTIEQAAAAVDAWEKAHPADAPGAMQRWHEAMARFPDRWSQAPWAAAAARAGKARDAVNAVYRAVRNDDPGAVEGAESPEVTRLLVVLGRELAGPDSSLREKAARFLALLGSPDATAALGKAARKETEPQTRRAMIDALADLGGAKGAKELAALKQEVSKAPDGTPVTVTSAIAPEALEGLIRMGKRNPVDRRIALRLVGSFALVDDAATANRVVDVLVACGPEGARGLEEALATPDVGVRLRVMGALAAAKDPKAVRPLSNFLLTTTESAESEKCRAAAEEAILSFGEAAVPHLLPALRNPRLRLRTGDLLRKITGASIGSGKPDDWYEWWKRKHPDWKEE